MADGIVSKEFKNARTKTVRPEQTAPKHSTGLSSTDADKLSAIRLGINVHLDALVVIANRIHNPEMRDAALGNIVKHHSRTVKTSPARMSELKYEVDSLFSIADMMSDDAKRIGMFAYIEKFAAENK